MNTQTLIPVLSIIAAVLAIGLIAWFASLVIRSKRLKNRFGPEYDYTLERLGNQRVAEADLKEREKRVDGLALHELNEHEKERYHSEWTEVQAGFIDDTVKSVQRANRLITEVMIARGFPVADFEQRTSDLSVVYPGFASKYRQAYAITTRGLDGAATTEELRQAMIEYHALFDQILGTKHLSKTTTEEQKQLESV